MTPKRIKNYYFCRDRYQPEDELPWLRINGLTSLKLPHPIVLVTGCFDLLHSGHMRMLTAARDQAGPTGTLIVAMDSDERVRTNKGPRRPYQTWVERSTALGYMPIDYLIEFNSDDELRRLARAVQADVQVIGADYKDRPTVCDWLPKCYVRVGGMSTSEIERRVLEGAALERNI